MREGGVVGGNFSFGLGLGRYGVWEMCKRGYGYTRDVRRIGGWLRVGSVGEDFSPLDGWSYRCNLDDGVASGVGILSMYLDSYEPHRYHYHVIF